MNSDFRDLLCEFNAAEVRYLVVGGYAFFVHASPRYTKDLDITNKRLVGRPRDLEDVKELERDG